MFSTSDVYPYNNETKIKLYNRATSILQCTHELTLNKLSLATCTPPYFTFEGGFIICICVLSEIERSNSYNEHILDKFVTSNKIVDVIGPLDMAIDDLKLMCSVSTLAIKGMTILQHLRTLCQKGLAKFTSMMNQGLLNKLVIVILRQIERRHLLFLINSTIFPWHI